MNKIGNKNVFNESKAEELYKSGAIDCEMAIILGVHKRRIADWRIKNGLLPNRYSNKPNLGNYVKINDPESLLCSSSEFLSRIIEGDKNANDLR